MGTSDGGYVVAGFRFLECSLGSALSEQLVDERAAIAGPDHAAEPGDGHSAWFQHEAPVVDVSEERCPWSDAELLA